MAKRMPKVQKRPIPLFGFIAYNNIRFHFTGGFDRLYPGLLIARGHLGPVVFQPFKKRCLAKQTIFNHFTISSQKIARRKAVKDRNIGQNQARLMKRTHKVFAMRCVNTGFASNRAVDLRQQRRGHLHKTDPTS